MLLRVAAAHQRAFGVRWSELRPETIRRIVIRTRESTVVPLIHHQPDSGLQGKFSLEYAAAAALLDRYPGFTSFTDAAVRREAARQLIGKVEVILDPGGSWLLDGQLDAELYTSDGVIRRTSLQSPPGSPDRPPSSEQLKSKLAECTRGLETDPETWTWRNAASTLRRFLQRPA
jgi:2-methylcitrate dehydratase PrpD